MRCLVDFVLDSDLCLADGAEPLTLNAPDGSFSLTLSNVQDRLESVLAAQLIFEADSLDGIRQIASEKLAAILNCLTYATNRKFALKTVKRAIDWTPGTIDRSALVFVETPEFDRAEPELDHDFVDTAERLLAMRAGDEQTAAMRWYRRGIQTDQLEEQFSYFWFALEIASEALKGTERVPSKCPKCNSPLFCEACNDHPTHRRYAGESIQHMVERVFPKNSKEVFDALQTIRHTLMHGGRIASVLSKLPFDDQTAVNTLAVITWRALGQMFDKPDPRPDTPLNFGDPESVVRRTLVAGAKFVTRLKGDPNDPQLRDIPEIKFEAKQMPRTPTAKDPPSG
jgi:hypothetical protein